MASTRLRYRLICGYRLQSYEEAAVSFGNVWYSVDGGGIKILNLDPGSETD